MNEDHVCTQEDTAFLMRLTMAMASFPAIWGAVQLMEGYEKNDAELKDAGLRMMLEFLPFAASDPGLRTLLYQRERGSGAH